MWNYVLNKTLLNNSKYILRVPPFAFLIALQTLGLHEVCFVGFVRVASVRISNVNSHTNKEKELKEKVFPNFCTVPYA